MVKKNIKKRNSCKPHVFYGILVFLGIFLALFFIYGLASNKTSISGNAIFDIEADYQEEGLKLLLKEGELIPASSKIIFETSDEKYEYDLKDFVSDDLVEGDFYVQGKSVSGSGEGYGVEGIKIIYPKVDFVLNIYSEADSEEEIKIKESESNKEILTKELEEKEELEQIQTAEPEETSLEEVVEKFEDTEETSVTDNLVAGILKSVSEFFFGLTGTGMVVKEFESEVQGEVSADEPFSYNLEEGQTAEIVSSSQDVKLNIENRVATITTDYFEEKKGFGEDYLGDNEKEIILNLSGFDFLPEQGELKISLIYDDEEIIFLITTLGEDEEIFSNKTWEIIEEPVGVLTEEERKILIEEFGNVSVKITNSEIVEGGVEITFYLEDYFMIRFYDDDFSEKDLKLQIESDRINWLKDIANMLSQKEIDSQ